MSQGVYVLGGKCPGGKCPGGKCLGGICPWGKCPGGTCPGGLCPRTIYICIWQGIPFLLPDIYAKPFFFRFLSVLWCHEQVIIPESLQEAYPAEHVTS